MRPTELDYIIVIALFVRILDGRDCNAHAQALWMKTLTDGGVPE